MKKKLNVFCVLMLVLKAAQVIIGNVMSFGENAAAFRQGWEDGRQATGMYRLCTVYTECQSRQGVRLG